MPSIDMDLFHFMRFQNSNCKFFYDFPKKLGMRDEREEDGLENECFAFNAICIRLREFVHISCSTSHSMNKSDSLCFTRIRIHFYN